MAVNSFQIQDVIFNVDFKRDKTDSISVISSPRPYQVRFEFSDGSFMWLENEIKEHKHPLILIDKYVDEKLLHNLNLHNIPKFSVEAIETNKDIDTVLKVCDFLHENQANRGSMLYVIGGGIVQDLGAFAGAMFKRGIPWTFIPTTLLSQGDSCLGGKTAVNHRGTKNMLGLFSAPRQVIIDAKFCDTLTFEDKLSGVGEIFRLLVTGGGAAFDIFNTYIDDFLNVSTVATQELVSASLMVKKKIVDYDEFEIDIRRSMNYGHSIGHAVEGLSDYKISHGIGVSIGILIENRIAFNRNLLSQHDHNKILEAGLKIIPKSSWRLLSTLPIVDLLPYLASDKKVEAKLLKVATLKSLGHMIFIDLPLNQDGMDEVINATAQVLQAGL